MGAFTAFTQLRPAATGQRSRNLGLAVRASSPVAAADIPANRTYLDKRSGVTADGPGLRALLD
jgi:hypothetical protein